MIIIIIIIIIMLQKIPLNYTVTKGISPIKKNQISPNPSLFFTPNPNSGTPRLVHPPPVENVVPVAIQDPIGTYELQRHFQPSTPRTWQASNFFSHGMWGITNLNLDTWLQKRHETDQKAWLSHTWKMNGWKQTNGGLRKMMFLFNRGEF